MEKAHRIFADYITILYDVNRETFYKKDRQNLCNFHGVARGITGG